MLYVVDKSEYPWGSSPGAWDSSLLWSVCKEAEEINNTRQEFTISKKKKKRQ